MLLDYQEQIGTLIEMSDRLKDEEAYDLQKIFSVVWPHLNLIVPDIIGGAIIGLIDDELRCHVRKKNDPIFIRWADVSPESMAKTRDALKKYDERDIIIWNFEDGAPLFTSGTRKNQAVSISWLCEHPHEENLFLLLVRNNYKLPFLSHETQGIKLTSRMIGWVANYALSYQSLIYKLKKEMGEKIRAADREL